MSVYIGNTHNLFRIVLIEARDFSPVGFFASRSTRGIMPCSNWPTCTTTRKERHELHSNKRTTWSRFSGQVLEDIGTIVEAFAEENLRLSERCTSYPNATEATAL